MNFAWAPEDVTHFQSLDHMPYPIKIFQVPDSHEEVSEHTLCEAFCKASPA